MSNLNGYNAGIKSLSGVTSITGDSLTTSTINCSGAATIGGLLTGSAGVSTTFVSCSGTCSTGGLSCTSVNCAGNATVSGGVTTGPLTPSSINCAGAVATGALTTTGNATVSGTLSSGALTPASISCAGAVSTGALTTTGNASVSGTLSSGALTPASISCAGAVATGALTTTGNASVSGTLSSGALTPASISCAGAVATGALTTTGNASVGGSTLKVDSVNTRVGIANTAPSYPLDVTGQINSSSQLSVGGTSTVLTANGLGFTASPSTYFAAAGQVIIQPFTNTVCVISTQSSGGFVYRNQTTSTNVFNVNSSGTVNIVSGQAYQINGTNVLNSTTLGSGVVNSSLQNVGTLTSLAVTGAITQGGIPTTPNTKYTSTVSNCTQVGTQTGTGVDKVNYGFTSNTSQAGITLNASSNSTFAYSAFGSAASFWLSVTSPYNSSGVYTGAFSTNGYGGEYLTAFLTSSYVATGMTFSNRASSTGCLIKSYVIQGADFGAANFYLLANNTIASPVAGTVTVTFNTSGIPPIYKFYMTITSMTGSSDVYMDNINIQGYVPTAASCTYFPNSVEIGRSYGTTYDATTPLVVNANTRLANDYGASSQYVTGGLVYYRQVVQSCCWRGTTVIIPSNSSGFSITVAITGPYVNTTNADLICVASNGDYGANNAFFPMSAVCLNAGGGTPNTGDQITQIVFWCRCNSTSNARIDYAIFFTPMY